MGRTSWAAAGAALIAISCGKSDPSGPATGSGTTSPATAAANAPSAAETECAGYWKVTGAEVAELDRGLADETAKEGGPRKSEADLARDLAAQQQQFMDRCTKLPPDATHCMKPGKHDPSCDAVLDRAEAPTPVQLAWTDVRADEDRVSLSVPTGWTGDLGTFVAPDKDGLSQPQIEISDGCGPDCKPYSSAEWAKLADEAIVPKFLDPFDMGEPTPIIQDEKIGTTGRLVVTSESHGEDRTVSLLAVIWTDGGKRYLSCQADLGHRFSANVDDFAKACREMKPASPAAFGSERDWDHARAKP